MPAPNAGTLVAVWVSSPSDGWVCETDALGTFVNQGVVWRLQGESLAAVPVAGGPGDAGCLTLYGSSAGDVWFAGGDRDGHQHFDGQTLTETDYRDDRIPVSLTGAGSGHVYGTGINLFETLVASDGGYQWYRVSGLQNDLALFALGVDDVLGTSPGGGVDRWDGGSVTHTNLALGTLRAIHGSSATDVWAVGDDGGTAHFDGANWTVVASPTSRTLNGVWAHQPGDAWAVGAQGTLLHFDGGTWGAVQSPTSEDLLAIHGEATGKAWAVGTHGALLHLR